MKNRLEISTKALRHFRTRRGWTLKQTAECLRKAPAQPIASLTNMYERIERTGITSPRTAGLLASHLRVTIDELQGAIKSEDVQGIWWLESRSDAGGGVLLPGLAAVQDRLLTKTESSESRFIRGGMPIHAKVQMDSNEGRLTLSQPDVDDLPERFWWSLRLADRTETGISWIEFTKVELEHIRMLMLEQAYRLADTVDLEGAQIPPEGAALGYEVRRVDSDQSKSMETRLRIRHYHSLASLKRSLLRDFAALAGHRFHLDESGDSVTVAPLDDGQMYSISRVFQPNGADEYRRAPWRIESVKALRSEVRFWLDTTFSDCTYFAFDFASKSFVPCTDVGASDK